MNLLFSTTIGKIPVYEADRNFHIFTCYAFVFFRNPYVWERNIEEDILPH